MQMPLPSQRRWKPFETSTSGGHWPKGHYHLKMWWNWRWKEPRSTEELELPNKFCALQISKGPSRVRRPELIRFFRKVRSLIAWPWKLCPKTLALDKTQDLAKGRGKIGWPPEGDGSIPKRGDWIDGCTRVCSHGGLPWEVWLMRQLLKIDYCFSPIVECSVKWWHAQTQTWSPRLLSCLCFLMGTWLQYRPLFVRPPSNALVAADVRLHIRPGLSC